MFGSSDAVESPFLLYKYLRWQVVLGQGYPVVSSRFQDPEDVNNSYWSPESVPSVKAQPWAVNYRDGLCGIREMDEGFGEDDPALDER